MGIPLNRLNQRTQERVKAQLAERGGAVPVSPVSYRIILPYPPSINHYWRQARGRFYISAEGMAYRNRVARHVIHRIGGESSRLALTINAYPPDRRKRDVDNIQKPLIDALDHGGLFCDDSQIKDLRTLLHESNKRNSRVEIEIREIP